MKCKKIICFFAAVLTASNLTGCNEAVPAWNPISENSIKIAIVGDEDYIGDNGSMEAMELAASDFYDKTGIRIETVIYNDDAEYNKAINCAKEIATNDSIAAVLVKQELDFIDAVAEIFNEAEKPFILTSGCYERTINNNYEYMLVDCINAKTAGSIMAEYIKEQDYKHIAFCHSDTQYEEDELKGLQAELEGSSVHLTDTLVGPYTQEDFNVAYNRWTKLGIDAVCISNYDIYNSDLVRMLREKGSDISVIGDYVMDTDEEIAINGKYLDGTAIVSMYINDENENNAEITDRFEKTYQMEMSEKAIQSYDIILLLGTVLSSDVTSSKELIEEIKSSEGYDGISGKLVFDENGCIIPNGNEMLVFKNGAFN